MLNFWEDMFSTRVCRYLRLCKLQTLMSSVYFLKNESGISMQKEKDPYLIFLLPLFPQSSRPPSNVFRKHPYFLL